MDAIFQHAISGWADLEHALSPFLPSGPFWPGVRTAILILFVVATLFSILWLYGGNIQNKNIGPLALRSRAISDRTVFQAPRAIVDSTLEAKTVRCTFHLQYIDRRGRPRFAKLVPKATLRFKLSALNKRLAYEKSDLVGYWNSKFQSALREDMIESGIAHEKEDQNFLLKDVYGDDLLKGLLPEEGEIVAVSSEVWNDLARSHREAVGAKLKRFQNFLSRRRVKDRFAKAPAYLDLPDLTQDANLYLRMHFSANPLTHPDPQVKTTAWLTVLTSAFALMMQWLYAGF